MSDWNRFLERGLAAGLTQSEWRLYAALGRCLLGFRKRSEEIGRDLLQRTSGLADGRSYEQARAGLVAKGLIRYVPSPGGRGKRSAWELLLDDPETPGLERQFPEEGMDEAEETPAPDGDFGDETAAATAAVTAAETPAPERPRSEKGEKGKNPSAPADTGAEEIDVEPSARAPASSAERPRGAIRKHRIEETCNHCGSAPVWEFVHGLFCDDSCAAAVLSEAA